MNLLPQQLTYAQLQTKWASIINPLLKNPASQPLLIKDVELFAGDNVVNHRLGRNLQGWYITRMRSNFAQIYDTQDSNQMQNLTLNLNASANVVVDIAVF